MEQPHRRVVGCLQRVGPIPCVVVSCVVSVSVGRWQYVSECNIVELQEARNRRDESHLRQLATVKYTKSTPE